MTRSSQSAAVPCRIAIGPVKKKGTTISAMVAVTGPAPCRQITPRARARTAAMASSAALPTITRASVSPPTGKMKCPLPRSMPSPSRTAAADPASPAAKVTAPITIALAARTWPRRGAGGERGADQAAPVLGGNEHRRDHERHDQPGKHPGDAGVGGPAAARGVPHGGRDVTRSLHREDPASLAVPAGQRGCTRRRTRDPGRPTGSRAGCPTR